MNPRSSFEPVVAKSAIGLKINAFFAFPLCYSWVKIVPSLQEFYLLLVLTPFFLMFYAVSEKRKKTNNAETQRCDVQPRRMHGVHGLLFDTSADQLRLCAPASLR